MSALTREAVLDVLRQIQDPGSWKGLFPIAVVNVVMTAVMLMFFGEAP